MESTIEAARARNVAGMWLGVNQRNARAGRFYQKSGFEVVGEKTFMVGPELHHDYVMEQAL
jgi:tRNA (guanine37-N1)-methyltransferase